MRLLGGEVASLLFREVARLLRRGCCCAVGAHHVELLRDDSALRRDDLHHVLDVPGLVFSCVVSFHDSGVDFKADKYRVGHLVADLGWVDLSLVVPLYAPFCMGR